MNPRARRARRLVRDRRRHYQLGSRALCPDTCLECAISLYDWYGASRFMNLLGGMVEVFRLVTDPDAPRRIRERLEEVNAIVLAARGETPPPRALPAVTLESGRQIQLDGHPCDRCGEMKPAHGGWALGHLYDSAADRHAWGLAMAQAEENGRRFLAERAAQEPEFCECGGPYAHVTPCDPGEEA